MHAESDMTVSAWRNTSSQKSSGTIFGLRLGKPMRDRLLNRGVRQVTLHLQDGPILMVTLKEAFWNKCPEFKHSEIGPWMLSQGFRFPWPKGQPPKFRLAQLGPAEFMASLR